MEDLSGDKSLENSVPWKPEKLKEPQYEEYVNPQGVRFTSLQQHTPYGSLCIAEIFQFLISLCNPLEKQNTEIVIHLGLSLLQVVFEIAADTLSNFPFMLALMKDELSRYCIMVGTSISG